MLQLLLTSELAGKLALLRVRPLTVEESTLFWYLYLSLLFKLLDFMMRVNLYQFFVILILLKKSYFFYSEIGLRSTNLVALESFFRALQFCISWKFRNSNIYQTKVIVCIICTAKCFYFVCLFICLFVFCFLL
jgi:hypothetical protein